MAASSNRNGLSRRAVLVSYAIMFGLFIPTLPVSVLGSVVFDFDGLPACVYPLLLLVLTLLGLCGFVVSVWQPQRRGWFVCGHACLAVYYVICALSCIFWILHPPVR